MGPLLAVEVSQSLFAAFFFFRFNCLKCGCAGEAKDANYRYRLSLKVADANDLFHITVFGTCLDPFFGITAGRLQR